MSTLRRLSFLSNAITFHFYQMRIDETNAECFLEICVTWLGKTIGTFLMCSMSENRLNNTTNTTNHYNNAFITTDIGNTHLFIVCH